MVAGVPCMCIRTTGTPSRAHRGSIAASAMPAETSFTTSAPAPSAARATSAFIVSTEIGTRTAARTAPSTGSRRRRSSPPGTAIAPGRVDSAPTSSARAPAATISAAASAARAGSRWRPPSENESGVAFRMPTSTTRSSASGPERVWSTGPASRAGGRGPASGRGCSGAPEATVLAPVLPQDLVDLGAIEDLALEQRLGHLVEHLDVASEQQLGVLVGLHDDAPHLGIDLHRGRLRVVDALGEVAAEEDLLLLLAEGDGPELLAHAPLADHLVRELGGALEVVARAGGHVAEHQLLGGAAAEEDGEVVDEERLGVRVPIVERDLLGQAERHAARDDRHLVHGIGSREELRDERVARLVVGRVPALLEADDHRPPLRAHHHLVLGELEVAHLDPLLVLAGRQERRLVHQVLEVGAGEARRLPGEQLDVDVLGDRHAPRVNPQDALAALDVGPRHDDAAVEAAGAQQRRVEHVGPVGGRDQDHALVRLEAVHLDEQLVECLLALVVAAAEAGAAMPTDGVDLVDEDDAGGVLLPLHEEVAHARRPDADEHLDEVRARDGEERHTRLARDRAGEQRLPGARRTDQEHALRDAAAELGELLRVLEEGDDLLELLLGLVDAGDVVERHLVGVLREQLGAALAEGHGLAAAHLHLTHEEDPDTDQEQHRRPLHQGDEVPGLGVLRAGIDRDVLLTQHLDQVRVLGSERLEPLARLAVLAPVPAADVLALDGDLGDPPLVHRLDEAAVAHLGLARLLLGDDGPQEKPHQQEEEPEPEIAGDGIQPCLGTGKIRTRDRNIRSPEQQCTAAAPLIRWARKHPR